MSSLSEAAPDDLECKFILILGKPGGGKGTISGKILEVRAIGVSHAKQFLFALLTMY
jgi:GTPase Era involved in 16S rRNA processing